MGRRRQIDLSVELVPIGTPEEREKAVKEAGRYILQCFLRLQAGLCKNPLDRQTAPLQNPVDKVLNKQQVENDKGK